MFNSKRVIFLMLFFLGLQFPSFAQEESSRIKKLARNADMILTGKVVQKKSAWNETKTKIYTKTTLQVEEYLKGKDDGNTIEVTYPGGEVGDVGELYTHMPKFEDKEEVLVFLQKDGKNKRFKVLNGEEGKIKLLRDAKTKEKLTSSNMKIKDLKAQIKRYLDEQ